MIPLVAWRNIWRHKIRSGVVILSIAVGLWAGAFMVAFSWGMYDQYMRETVETQISHLQLHHPLFEDDHEVQYYMSEAAAVKKRIGNRKEELAFTARTVSSGMVSSPSTASGVTIYGIFPEEEDKVTKLASRIVEGKYLDSAGRNPVLIGEKLAKKLKVKLKNKIILTFQDTSGEIVAGAFRIAGTYRSKNTRLDEMNVYVRSSDLNRMLNTEGAVHEIAILLKNGSKADPVKEELQSAFPALSVKTWKDLSPELELVINSFGEYMYIFVGIILLALTFGIVNTMLMTVLERVREIGMLMAIGMTRLRIFFMIMLEAIYLALVGGPLGLLTAYFTVQWTGKRGIDMSMFSEGLSEWGFSSVVYPKLAPGYYFPLTMMTVLTAVLSAIYPAIRALRLKPSEAIRKI
ncbi:MAG: ABC transporter permease [Bacteroidetes bacterium]|nr:MAG: ABC transporter permease [Bacteroidota bacterium]